MRRTYLKRQVVSRTLKVKIEVGRRELDVLYPLTYYKVGLNHPSFDQISGLPQPKLRAHWHKGNLQAYLRNRTTDTALKPRMKMIRVSSSPVHPTM